MGSRAPACVLVLFMFGGGVVSGEQGPEKPAQAPNAPRARDPGNAERPPEKEGRGDRPAPRAFRLEEILVTATRTERSAYDVPSFAEVIGAGEIGSRRLARTLPEALHESAGVMVQKTGHGQGSPYLRGFTGFRTLMLIDGIRLNDSVFRDGPNQYWNTVDPFSLDRLEVVHGPSGSVLYGSDAVGGTVNAITRGWEEWGGDRRFGGTLFGRFSTAEHSRTGRLEAWGHLDEHVSVLAGVTLKRFGDLRGGRTVGLQDKTGYDEWDGDLKFAYRPDEASTLLFYHQRVTQDDAWRTHKTIYGIAWEGTVPGSEKKRVLDEARELSYLRYRREDVNGWMDGLEFTLSWQTLEEDRFRVKSDDTSDRQGFDVGTLGLGLQARSDTKAGTWTYGFDLYRDFVDSYKKKYGADGTLDKVGIQGPVADDARYDLFGLYLQDEVPLSYRLNLQAGARATWARVDADRVEDPVTGTAFGLSDRFTNLSGSARFTYDLDEARSTKLFTGLSQGFRAPNLSDLTRFDSARSNEVETPSPGLDPERYLSWEAGVKALRDRWSGQAAYFYTDIRDMIVRVPTGNVINGEYEVTKKNAGQGYVHGIELEGEYRVWSHLTASTGGSWIYGSVEGYPESTLEKKREPLSRLAPAALFAVLGWGLPEDPFRIEAVMFAARRQNHLSSRDAADVQRIPPGGTPGYTVYTLRGRWRLKKGLTLALALENLFDADYRIHGSGVNEPGRNLVASLTWRF